MENIEMKSDEVFETYLSRMNIDPKVIKIILEYTSNSEDEFYQSGYDAGYDNGFEDGYKQGDSDGYQNGYDIGHEDDFEEASIEQD